MQGKDCKNYGRINHGDNVQQYLFDCYVNKIIKTMKKEPNKRGRELVFERMTEKREDRDLLKKVVFERWNDA